MAIAGLVLGIIGVVGGIVGFFVPYVAFVTFIFSIVALVLGAVVMKKEKNGMAIAALVLGIVGVCINIGSVSCTIWVLVTACNLAAAANAAGSSALILPVI